jgi:hypothetical protein
MLKEHTNLVVNINGESADSLINQYQQIAEAAQNLIMALMKARPHGRDYQTYVDDTALRHDRNRHDELLRAVDDVNSYAQESISYIYGQQHAHDLGGVK